MIKLREARNKDSDQIIKLIRDCFNEYPKCYLDVDVEMPELKKIYSYFKFKNGNFWVFEKNNKVIGSMGLAPKGKDLELHKLYIKKNQRGKGLAKIMVIKAEKYAKKFGFKKMILWTDTRFKEAHLMYLKLNYKKMKKTRRLYDISDTTEFHFQKKIF